MNPVPQDALESTVIKTVLDFYQPYLDKVGRRKLAEAVKAQIGSEVEDFVAARQRVEEELQRISPIINNLLDNITSTNREYVDKRLLDLNQQRQKLEARLEELDRLALSQAEINNIVADAVKFISTLEFTLSHGLPQEKLVAIRQCIERILVDKPTGIIKMRIRLVPAGNLQATRELKGPI
jgi:hypothetical protein